MKEDMDEDEDEEVQPIMSATRPPDPADAAEWDSIGHVHVGSDNPRVIKQAVKNFGDFVKTRYDSIRETKKAIDTQKEAGANTTALENELTNRQEIFFRVVEEWRKKAPACCIYRDVDMAEAVFGESREPFKFAPG